MDKIHERIERSMWKHETTLNYTYFECSILFYLGTFNTIENIFLYIWYFIYKNKFISYRRSKKKNSWTFFR